MKKLAALGVSSSGGLKIVFIPSLDDGDDSWSLVSVACSLISVVIDGNVKVASVMSSMDGLFAIGGGMDQIKASA